MRQIAILLSFVSALWTAPVGADVFDDALIEQIKSADVVIVGDLHDNPAHHEIQADVIEGLNPKAVVWEMLTEETAARINAGALETPGNLDKVLEWGRQEWPEFHLYTTVLLASQGRQQYGGLVPRAATQKAMKTGIGAAFGISAAEYGLMVRLPKEEQAAREALQQAAHCNAMPAELVTEMVSIQRLRDAVLARATVEAMDETGGPVVVITGNGHARKDWGIPSYLSRVRPGLRVLSIGQSEDGHITGVFDVVLDSPSIDRPDPCAVFEKAASE